MSEREVIRDVLQKWAGRGYVEPDLVQAIADDIWGVLVDGRKAE